MKLLVIEDNDIKYELVLAFLDESSERHTVERAASYQSGIEALLSKRFDCVILDMTLPVSDVSHSLVGIDNLNFGGQLILREALRKRVDAKFIVLSQYSTFVRGDKEVTFEQLRIELESAFPERVLGCVRLDSSSVSWKTELGELLQNESFNR